MQRGRAIAQAVRRRLPTRSGHVGFVVNKMAQGQISCEYFGLPCKFSFHQLLHIHNHHHHHHSGLVQ
jgi:hypothetical protein